MSDHTSLIDEMMGQLRGNGFDLLASGANGALVPKHSIDDALRRDEARKVAELFSSELGQWVLLWLMKATILQPQGERELYPGSMEVYALEKKYRDGQAAVIFMIMGALQLARGELDQQGGDDVAQ